MDRVYLVKGKTKIYFGKTRDIIPDEFTGIDVSDVEMLSDIQKAIHEKISENQQKIIALSAYSASSVLDLSALISEISASLVELERSYRQALNIEMILKFVDDGFTIRTKEEKDNNEQR